MKKEACPGVTVVDQEKFTFGCDNTVPCFTHCCWSVDMYLYPYDVIRLKTRLGLTSEAFLLKHTIVAFRESSCFPNVTLKMSEAQGHPCTFLTEKGCAIYEDRPYSCRAYPLELAMYGNDKSGYQIASRVIPEPHCKGHGLGREWVLSQWLENQDMEAYNRHNSVWSQMVNFLYAPNTFAEKTADNQAMGMAYMATYNLDTFRRHVVDSDFLNRYDISEERLQTVKIDDIALMYLGFDWIYRFLAGRGPLRHNNLGRLP